MRVLLKHGMNPAALGFTQGGTSGATASQAAASQPAGSGKAGGGKASATKGARKGGKRHQGGGDVVASDEVGIPLQRVQSPRIPESNIPGDRKYQNPQGE